MTRRKQVQKITHPNGMDDLQDHVNLIVLPSASVTATSG